MEIGNYSINTSVKPDGCKSCSSNGKLGCNRMNVYDWLNKIPLNDSSKPFQIIEVSFNKGSRKEYYRNNTHHVFNKGEFVTVEGVGGYDVGTISVTGELVKLQMKKYGITDASVAKRILHPTTPEELQSSLKQKEREQEILNKSRTIARNLNLDMKLCEVEIQADSKKGTFFYTADQRVDFRELIKLFAGDFKMKVEMKQIGARQESGKVGGIGACGRELCCSTWLIEFKSVNTMAARYQNLSINQTKLSGQCGRLKCCLNYELDTYMDALKVFPENADSIETLKGVAHLQKKDIFKNLMWYSYSENNKQYPLSIDRVKEIIKLNKLGQKADELQPVEIETRESKLGILPDSGFINDVGQLTLKSLERNSKKKKQGNKSGSHQPQQNTLKDVVQNNNKNLIQQDKKQGQPQNTPQSIAPKINTAPNQNKPQQAQNNQSQNRPQNNQNQNRSQNNQNQGQNKPQNNQGQRPNPQQQQQAKPNQPQQQPKPNQPQPQNTNATIKPQIPQNIKDALSSNPSLGQQKIVQPKPVQPNNNFNKSNQRQKPEVEIKERTRKQKTDDKEEGS